MYTAFASVYDRLMRDVDYQSWAERYASLLRSAGVSAGHVCECACGTGSLTLPLARMGYRMTGIDLSSEMLSAAAAKAKDAGLDIPFVRQDMTRLTLHRRQDAVLATCDGVNYLTSVKQLRAFFTAAHKSLKPGGVLIFDVSTPEKLSVTLGMNTLGSRDEDISYIWQNYYDKRTRIVDLKLSFFVRNENGTYDRFEESQRQRAHSREELESLLSECGFSAVRFYGGLKRRAPLPGDDRWHIMAVKPKEKT